MERRISEQYFTTPFFHRRWYFFITRLNTTPFKTYYIIILKLKIMIWGPKLPNFKIGGPNLQNNENLGTKTAIKPNLINSLF
jgi:hypothetical protein